MHEQTPEACAEWQALRKLRRSLGITQREVATLLNVTEHRIRRLELGDVKATDKDKKAAAALIASWETNPPKRKRFQQGRASDTDSVKTKVLSQLTNVPQTVQEISDAANVSVFTARKYLQQHAKKSRVTRVKVSSYTITAAGYTK